MIDQSALISAQTMDDSAIFNTQKTFMFEHDAETKHACITNFHNQVDIALKRKIPELLETENIDKVDSNFLKRKYEIHYPEKLR